MSKVTDLQQADADMKNAWLLYLDMSDRRAELIRQAHNDGHSWAIIAQVLGVTRSAVSRFAKEVTS